MSDTIENHSNVTMNSVKWTDALLQKLHVIEFVEY
jgi:hypothetical protein